MNNVQLDRDLLLRPLQAVTGVVERRQTLPILSNVLLEGRGGRLTLLATDLEIQVSATADGLAPDAEFLVTVSAKKLLDILRTLPEGAQVQLEPKDNRMQLRSGKSRFNLQSLPATDFPKITEGPSVLAEFGLPQSALRKLFGLTQYAMAQQDIRYYLNGMLMVVDGQELTLVATDGHRLAMVRHPLLNSYQHQEVILPRKAVMELSRLLADTDHQVLVTLLPNQARFEFDGIVLVTKLVDGKFPDYNRVIPANHAKQFDIDRALLQQSLQRAAILSNEKFRGVRWVVASGSLRIASSNTEQEEAEEELEIEYAGDALDVGFNIQYLQDVLSNVDAATVHCAFGDANSAMLVTTASAEAFKYVVMPMRI
ncbi:MAG: DNA polymerase III subunit beta [Burkholderiales bacterium]|nr:DNA polymerase III subunit beta [Burkholderiales bacterium]